MTTKKHVAFTQTMLFFYKTSLFRTYLDVKKSFLYSQLKQSILISAISPKKYTF